MSTQSLIGQKLAELRQELTATTNGNKKAKDKVSKQKSVKERNPRQAEAKPKRKKSK